MSYFRSEPMKHYKLILPRDNAEQIMHILGICKLIQFMPSPIPILNKPFMHQVKRCTDSLLKLKDIQQILQEKELPSISICKRVCSQQMYSLLEDGHEKGRHNSAHQLQAVDAEIQQIWHKYKEYSSRISEIKQKMEYFRENLAIIQAGTKRFGPLFFSAGSNNLNLKFQQFSSHDLQGSSQVNYKVGILNLENQISFKTTVIRISRNNCLSVCIPFSQIFQKQQDKKQNSKVIFFLLFSGSRTGALSKKLDRLITSYSSKQYNLPENSQQIQKNKKFMQDQYQQNKHVLQLNQKDLNEYLLTICQPLPNQNYTKIQHHKIYLMKQRQIYTQLSEMQLFTNFLQVNIYIRKTDIIPLQQCLQQIQKSTNCPSGQLIQISQKQANPPSHFSSNAFTRSAQQIVQTYGVPKYKEANPAFFTYVTFPFLFGVMFGDIAHGSILMALGLYLAVFRRWAYNSIFKQLAPHRFLILLMGFFSTYCGFIYNDFMSISLDLFGSCFDVKSAIANNPINRISSECVYPFGVDPVWAVASNNLNYINSLKMKIAVIIAVLHMTLGVFIKASNAIHFRKKLDFFFQFVPQLVFLVGLFGYMDFLIVYKWLKPWTLYDPSAPSIITTMINLPLKMGKTDNCCGGMPMWGTYGETSQNSIQLFLLIIAVISVPLMLLPKPMLLIKRRKIIQTHSDQIQELIQQKQNDIKDQQNLVSGNNSNHETNSQIFVHQLIQTIEYVLGCISNTASYLRLWALSLAHSQLSEVFFQKTVQKGMSLGFSGIPLMIITFPILAFATLSVLLCMDTMECFLHTLRLHWVEFQNKFYKGNGYSFDAFSFKQKISQQLKSQ